MAIDHWRQRSGATARTVVVAALATWLGGTATAQTPLVLNGRVETRPSTSPSDAVKAFASAAEPAWIAWTVPMAAGGGLDLCSQWSPDAAPLQAVALEPTPAPVSKVPPSPVRLEGGTSLMMLARVAGGRVDRLRTLHDECPVDAGGRTVHWLTGVSPADSLRGLEALLAPTDPAGRESHIRLSAVAAIALHADSGADDILERIVAPGTSDALVRPASLWMGRARGARGFDALRQRLQSEAHAERRRLFVAGLGETRQPQTAAVLLALARTDTDPQVRGQAVHGYAMAAPASAVGALGEIIRDERDESVRRRAVGSLGTLAAGAGVPALIDLARSGPSPAVRKEAVSALSRTRDARAQAFLEDLVAR